MDETRRKIIATGAAATAMAAVERVFGQQVGKGAGAMSFYEKGPVRIHYEEFGSGFPLLLIPGGGLESMIAGLNNTFNITEEFKGEYRGIVADLRNAINRGEIPAFHGLSEGDRNAFMEDWKTPLSHFPAKNLDEIADELPRGLARRTIGRHRRDNDVDTIPRE